MKFPLTLVCCILLLFYSNSCNARRSVLLHQSTDLEKHFVLVHGACHGAWSWYKIIALLKSAGHNVTAIDLASSGINPKQALDVPTLSEYFEPLMDFMANLDSNSKVILVGHSLGGMAISKAMEEFPNKISAAVFVAAVMNGPNFNLSAYNEAFSGSQRPQLDNHFTYDNGPNNPPTTLIHGPMYLAAYQYQLSPLEDLALATTLVRPIYVYTNLDLSKELSQENYGSVYRVFISASEDKAFTREHQEWILRDNPPDEVKVIEGADHMAMMSKPAELFAYLMDIAQKYHSY